MEIRHDCPIHFQGNFIELNKFNYIHEIDT